METPDTPHIPQLASADVAVINTNIQYIQRDILEIKLALRDQYATRESLVQVAKDTELRLGTLERITTTNASRSEDIARLVYIGFGIALAAELFLKFIVR